jgi:mRNA interferase YafQ
VIAGIYELRATSKYRKDRKLAKKRGLDMDLLDDVIQRLMDGKTLEAKYNDHALTGGYTGFRECHIQPDWLLIYAKDDAQLVLIAARTGSHSDLL